MAMTMLARKTMLLCAAWFSIPNMASASPAEMPVPARESSAPEGSSRLAETGAFGLVLAALVAGVVLYGLYVVLFDDDYVADQPACR